MYPHPKATTSFKYPEDGLLQLRGVVQEGELRHPHTMLDADGEECLLVIKNGNATGLTIGRLTGIESFTREIDAYDIRSTSMEVAIHPYSRKVGGAFSAPGDSGSVVVDGKGRIVGIITAGCGPTDSTDVTYVTPFYWVLERIKAVFPNAHLYPITA